MKLTPLDIRHKEFKRGMRGYADVEVDEFLDEVADEYERLFKENIDLQDRVESLEEKVAGYKRIEETLQKTLVNAQASAEEQKQNANKQAQLVLQDAELKARQLVNEAYSERQAIEQSMAKLRSAEEDFRFKFRQLLDGYLRQLQDTPEVAAEPRRPRTSRVTPRRSRRRSRGSRRRSGPRPPRRAREAPPARAGAPEEPVAPEMVAPAAEALPSRPAPDPFRRPSVPDEPAVAPARGRGGVQAGVAAPCAETPSRSRRRAPAGRRPRGHGGDARARAGRSSRGRRRGRRGSPSRAHHLRRERRPALRRGHRGERERVQVVTAGRSPQRAAA